MGYLKDVHTNKDIQAFPGAEFEIAGEVPQSQCSEAKIEGDDAITEAIGDLLTDPGKFVGWALAGKYVTITANTGGLTGTFQLLGNGDNSIFLELDPGDGTEVAYYVHNGGSLILTRNVPSFAQYIHDAGYAYTIKAGKLYTNAPSAILQNACSILFDPLT